MEDDKIQERISAVIASWYRDQDRDQIPSKESFQLWFMSKRKLYRKTLCLSPLQMTKIFQI